MGNSPSDPTPTDGAPGKDKGTDEVNRNKSAGTRKDKTNVRENVTSDDLKKKKFKSV